MNCVCSVFPNESVAVHVTVVVPTGNVEPDGGVQVGVIVPSSISVADTEYVTVIPVILVEYLTMFAGTEITGGKLSDMTYSM